MNYRIKRFDAIRILLKHRRMAERRPYCERQPYVYGNGDSMRHITLHTDIRLICKISCTADSITDSQAIHSPTLADSCRHRCFHNIIVNKLG